MDPCRSRLAPLRILHQQIQNSWNGKPRTNKFSAYFFPPSEEAMAVTVGLTTSRDVWLALERVFSHGSKTREIRLKVELQLMKKGSRTVAEFSRDFKNLCDQLLAIGRPVDETYNSHFLRDLGTDFSGFSSTQLALSSLPRFHDLVPLAESYDLFQKSLESNSFAPAAFTATRNFSGRGCQFRNRRSRGPPGHNPAGSNNRHPPRYKSKSACLQSTLPNLQV